MLTRFGDFEVNVGDLASIVKVEKKKTQVFKDVCNVLQFVCVLIIVYNLNRVH